MWQPFEASEADVEALASLVRELHGRPSGELSEAVRARMEEHSWARLGPALRAAIGFESGATVGPGQDTDDPSCPARTTLDPIAGICRAERHRIVTTHDRLQR